MYFLSNGNWKVHVAYYICTPMLNLFVHCPKLL